MSRVVDIKGRVLNEEIVDFRVEVSETEPWTLRYVGIVMMCVPETCLKRL